MYFQVLLHLFYKLSARYSAPSRGRNPALPSKEPRRRHGARERDCSDVRISALSCVGDRPPNGRDSGQKGLSEAHHATER